RPGGGRGGAGGGGDARARVRRDGRPAGRGRSGDDRPQHTAGEDGACGASGAFRPSRLSAARARSPSAPSTASLSAIAPSSARQVVVGFNHRFGRGARGDADLLRDLGGRLGFSVDVVEPLMVDGAPVSSTAIRAALGRGDLEAAARMLGRPYTLPGKVVTGAGRGRTLGFPTANIAPERPVLVAAGVYACTAEVAGQSRRAVVNIGVRPTFEE